MPKKKESPTPAAPPKGKAAKDVKESKATKAKATASGKKEVASKKTAMKKGTEKNTSKAEASQKLKKAPTVSNKKFIALGKEADGFMKKKTKRKISTDSDDYQYFDSVENPEERGVRFNDQVYHRVVEEPDFHSGLIWMTLPPSATGTTRGLQGLNLINEVEVRQAYDKPEGLEKEEFVNRYYVRNAKGEIIFFAFEDFKLWMKLFCGRARSFQIHAVNKRYEDVFIISRPLALFGPCALFNCCSCINPCSFTVNVESAAGKPLGQIVQICSFWRPWFDIRDRANRKLFEIGGPCCMCNNMFCACESDFQIVDVRTPKVPVGMIFGGGGATVSERWSGTANYIIDFPPRINAEIKVTIIAASMLLDIMYFESSRRR